MAVANTIDTQRASNLRGIFSMLLAVVGFAAMDASMKMLGERYSPLQVTCLRGMSSLPFVLLLVGLQGRWRELRPVRWELHLLRGALAICMLGLFVYSVRTLSLSSAYAIFLCGPLLTTALSVPILREHVDGPRWIAIVIGLIGVIVMIRPTAADMVTLGALAAFVAAVFYACAAIMIRFAAQTETTLGMSFSFVLLIGVVAGAIAYPNWAPIRTADVAWIVLLGFSGAIGQYFVIEAFRSAPASVVAPFDYTALIWGGLIDWFVWHTLPNTRMVFGGSVVVATGLYLIFRERKST